MSNLPDWFTPSNDDGKTTQDTVSKVVKMKDGNIKVLGWREIQVTCPSGFDGGIYYDKDGVLKLVVKKDGPNYEWPDGINPIESTIQKLTAPNNTWRLILNPEGVK